MENPVCVRKIYLGTKTIGMDGKKVLNEWSLKDF